MGWMGTEMALDAVRKQDEARSLGVFWVSAFLVTDTLLVFAFMLK